MLITMVRRSLYLKTTQLTQTALDTGVHARESYENVYYRGSKIATVPGEFLHAHIREPRGAVHVLPATRLRQTAFGAQRRVKAQPSRDAYSTYAVTWYTLGDVCINLVCGGQVTSQRIYLFTISRPRRHRTIRTTTAFAVSRKS